MESRKAWAGHYKYGLNVMDAYARDVDVEPANSTSTVVFPRICIIGMGLVGGSLARALRQAGACREIVGCDLSEERLNEALQLNAIDSGATDMASAVRDADAVVLAAPVGAMPALFESLKKCVSPTTIITDVGSTKGSIVDAAQRVFDGLPENFVPGHPLAGGENSGVGYSDPELFVGCNVILTPLPTTNCEAVHQVRRMWQQVGANVFEMTVSRHDEILGATSHLPHILAYLLVDILASNKKKDELFRYTAGGFRDFTRIASSDPGLWCDISLANRAVIAGMLGHYGEALGRMAKAIDEGDRAAITAVFTRAKMARDQGVLVQDGG